MKSKLLHTLSLACGATAGLMIAPAVAGDSSPQPTFANRTQNNDGSSSMTVGSHLLIDWDTKVGVDMRLSAPDNAVPDPDRLLNKGSQSGGAGWASVSIPGLSSPIGWEKASIDARVDPARDEGRLGATLSRSLPLGETVAVTLSNGYGVTQALAPTSGPTSVAAQPLSQHWETLGALRVDVLSTATALSADSKLSSTEDKWLRTYSAEQRVLGPLSITGSLSETANGGVDRSIKAGFKKTW